MLQWRCFFMTSSVNAHWLGPQWTARTTYYGRSRKCLQDKARSDHQSTPSSAMLQTSDARESRHRSPVQMSHDQKVTAFLRAKGLQKSERRAACLFLRASVPFLDHKTRSRLGHLHLVGAIVRHFCKTGVKCKINKADFPLLPSLLTPAAPFSP